MPTTPPWLAQPHAVHKIMDETFSKLHIPASLLGIYGHRDYNLYAAFPSLHAAFPLVAAVHGWMHRRSLGLVLGAWMLTVWFVIVYLGEHLVVDIAGAVVYAAMAIVVVELAGRWRLAGARRLAQRAQVPERIDASGVAAGEADLQSVLAD